MILAAVADVHYPRYYIQYLTALSACKECKDVNIIIFCGDMVYRGRIDGYRNVIQITKRYLPNAKIIAVFGNEEFIGTEEQYVNRYKDVIWLNDNYVIEGQVAIYGTRGALDRLTRWQRKHHPELSRVYIERCLKLKNTVTMLKSKGYKVIVAMHYAPTYKTLEGEDKSIWPEMGSRFMEKAIIESKPDLVLHGHAHKSRRLEALVDSVKVVNVSLPARKSIYLFEI